MVLPGDYGEALLTAVVDTFENLAFMEAEAATNGSLSDDHIRCRLAIKAPTEGQLELRIGKDLAKRIAGTVWSMQQDDIDEQMLRDTVAEILNTLAGRFMKNIVPEDRTFELGLPEILTASPEQDVGWRDFFFTLDKTVFIVAIRQ